MTDHANKITQRERAAVLQSLGAGVVPGVGLHHIQVGRNDEVQAVVRDLEMTAQGGAAVRFVVGRYGSGKTFFLHLIRAVALQKKFVVLQADITTERRLYGTGGQARALFGELMKNLATKAKPEGGALSNLVERWVGDVDHTIRSAGGGDADVTREMTKRLQPLQELVSGFDFAHVLGRYYDGHVAHNEVLQQSALRWLRAEYTTKTEARQELGVRTIIDDESFYDYLKLMAAFVRLAGFAGLLVNIDELVVLSHRLSNSTARNKNFEAILRIINDCLQGGVEGLAVLFAGTPECVEDQRRGLFSYEALKTRLAPNRFAVEGRRDLSSPLIRLESLTPEDCVVLMKGIRNVFALGKPERWLIPDEAIFRYVEDCQRRMGAAAYQTPRDTVKDFVGLLNVLEQNPATSWESLLADQTAKPFSSPVDPALAGPEVDDLTEFRL